MITQIEHMSSAFQTQKQSFFKIFFWIYIALENIK